MVFESEIRSFITKEKYDDLMNFFKLNAVLVKEDYQETSYFSGEIDLRIQKNNFYSKVWLKKGKIHDDSREEIEIKFSKDDFSLLEKLFVTLGYTINIKWFRNRLEFDWCGITVCLDYTKGYGYIIELELLCDEAEKEKAFSSLKDKLVSLGVHITSKEEFNEKFEHYKVHWKELTQ